MSKQTSKTSSSKTSKRAAAAAAASADDGSKRVKAPNSYHITNLYADSGHPKNSHATRVTDNRHAARIAILGDGKKLAGRPMSVSEIIACFTKASNGLGTIARYVRKNNMLVDGKPIGSDSAKLDHAADVIMAEKLAAMPKAIVSANAARPIKMRVR